MNKLLATIVASTFALTAVSGFAADTTKKEELTKEQRSEMRTRADKLAQARTEAPAPAKTAVTPAPAVKKPHAKKVNKTSSPAVKAQPKT
jgi:hypothetical protein